MKTRLCLLALLTLLLAFQGSLRAQPPYVTIPGPFDNTQTALEFTDCDSKSRLYALNALTKPEVQIGANRFMMYGLYEPYAGRWKNESFGDPFGQPIHFPSYPAMIGRNAREVGNDVYSLSVVQHGNGFMARGTCFENESANWHERLNFPPNGMDRFTRLVVSRRSANVQWLAAEWLNHPNDRLVTTTDGWEDWIDVPLCENLPEIYAFYSLAIDDREEPHCAVAAMSAEQPVLGEANDPHAPFILCDRVYFTTNGGDWWDPIPVEDLWDPLLTNMYNVQVAMIPTNMGDPDGDYFVYVIGTDLTNNQIFSTWTVMTPNGFPFPWSVPNPGHMDFGTPEWPTYIYDMVVEWDENESSYRLFAATTDKLYSTLHNGGGVVDWDSRMGTPPAMIMTRDFRDIAVDRTSPHKHFAVAGISMSYVTEDAGITWQEIYNCDRMTTFPASVKQWSTNMLALYSEDRGELHSSSVYRPVCIQRAPSQHGTTPNSGFSRTVQIGYTHTAQRDRLFMDVEAQESRYYAAYTDARLQLVGPNSRGVVYYSVNDGQGWGAGLWANRQFSTDEFLAPQPSCLIVDPQLPTYAYVAFNNTQTGQAVPPFAYTIDGGLNWQVPANTGLPLTDGDRLITGGYMLNGTYVLYLAQGNLLWNSLDRGATWSPCNLPGNWGGAIIISMVCQDDIGEYLAIASNTQMAVTHGACQWWFDAHPAPTGGVLQQLAADMRDDAAQDYWATVMYTDPQFQTQPRLYATHDGGWNWSLIAEWCAPALNGVPTRTALNVEIDDENNRSVTWYAQNLTPGQAAWAADVNPVRYYDFSTALILEEYSQTRCTENGLYPFQVFTYREPATELTIPTDVWFRYRIRPTGEPWSDWTTDGATHIDDQDPTWRYLLNLPTALPNGGTVEYIWYADSYLWETVTSPVGANIWDPATGPRHSFWYDPLNAPLPECFYIYAGTDITQNVLIPCDQRLVIQAQNGSADPVRVWPGVQFTFACDHTGISVLGTPHLPLRMLASTSVTFWPGFEMTQGAFYAQNATFDRGVQFNATGLARVAMEGCSWSSYTGGMIFDHTNMDNITLHNTDFVFGDPDAGISVLDGSIYLGGCTLRNGGSHGVLLFNADNSSIKETTISNCRNSGLVNSSGGAGVTIGCCTFSYNGGNLSPEVLDVSGELWFRDNTLNTFRDNGGTLIYFEGLPPEYKFHNGRNNFFLNGSTGYYAATDWELVRQNYLQEYGVEPNPLRLDYNYWNRGFNARYFTGGPWYVPAPPIALTPTYCGGSSLAGYEPGELPGDVPEGTPVVLSEHTQIQSGKHAHAARVSHAAQRQYLDALAKAGSPQLALNGYWELVQTAKSRNDSVAALLGAAWTYMRYHEQHSLSAPLPELAVTTVQEFIHLVAETAVSLYQSAVVTGESESSAVGVPATYALYQNYPNPFNPRTEIRFDLPESAPVELRIYNTLGQMVATLMDETHPAGSYHIAWNGTNDSGLPVSSGMYIYQLKAGNFVDSKKMLLMK